MLWPSRTLIKQLIYIARFHGWSPRQVLLDQCNLLIGFVPHG